MATFLKIPDDLLRTSHDRIPINVPVVLHLRQHVHGLTIGLQQAAEKNDTKAANLRRIFPQQCACGKLDGVSSLL